MAEYVTPVNQYLKSIDLQTYDRYLPNAFNDSLTILEKLNKIVHHMNETNQLTNELITKWNEFTEIVNDGGLIDSKIEDALKSETLIKLIDNELMIDFKNEINQSTNEKLLNVLDQVDVNRKEILEKAKQSDLNVIAANIKEKADKSETVDLRNQIDTLIITAGDSSPEIVQGRIDSLGNAFPTIKGHTDNIEHVLKTGITNFSFNWEKGTISGSGQDAESITRLRSKGLSNFGGYSQISITIDEGYKLALQMYNQSGAYFGMANNSFYTSSFTFRPAVNVYYRLVMSKIDDSEIQLSEVVKLKISTYFNPQLKKLFSNEDDFSQQNGYSMDFNKHSIWEIGTFSVGDGSLVGNQFRLRTKEFLPHYVSHVKSKDGFSFALVKYNENGSFVNISSFLSDSILETGFKYKIILKSNVSDTSPIFTEQYDKIGLFGGKVNDSIPEKVTRNEDANIYGYSTNFSRITQWEKGTITETGVKTPSESRIRTKTFIPNQTKRIIAKPGFEFALCSYDQTGEFIKLESFFTDKELENTYQYTVIIRKSTNSNINIDSYENILLLSGKYSETYDFNLNDLSTHIDLLHQSRGNIGLSVLDQMLEQRVNQHISDNGMSINGVTKTRMEIKDWLLNRNNCKYRGKLYKRGKYLVDKDNKQVEIMGIGTHHLLQYSSLHSYDALKTLKYYGVNLVRLTAYPKDYKFVKSHGENAVGYLNAKEETKAEMDRIIQHCINLGLYVIVDWHVLHSDGDINQYTDDAVEFFDYFASKYANIPNMIYELLNEPFGNTIVSQADYISKTYSKIKQYVTDPIIILGVGSSSIIDTYNWLTTNRYNDIFISNHDYIGLEEISDQDVAYRIKYYFENLNYPMFITEWGNSDHTGDGVTNDVLAIKYMDTLHELGVPHVVWKFTFQDMTTAMLKNNLPAEQGYLKYGGWLENDLSHNGKIFFNKFSENAFDKWIERNKIGD